MSEEVENTEEVIEQGTPEPEKPKAWYDGFDLPDEYVGTIQNKSWNSPADAIKSYIELERFKGADEKSLVKIPKGDDEDGWKSVFNKLGRPEDPDGYVFNVDKDAGISEDEVKWFKKSLHDMGVRGDKATRFFDDLVGRVTEMSKTESEAAEQAQSEEIGELKKRWGQKFDERVELANRALRDAGVDDDMIGTITGTIGYAKTIEVFANIGQKINGDTVITNREGLEFGKSREQYIADKDKLLAEIKRDPKRLEQWSTGRGPDNDKLNALRRTINSL